MKDQDEILKFVVKSFTQLGRNSKFVAEISSNHFLNGLNLIYSRPVKIAFMDINDQVMSVGMYPAQGISLLESMEQLGKATKLEDRKNLLESAIHASQLVGKALAELNTAKRVPFNEKAPDRDGLSVYVKKAEDNLACIKGKQVNLPTRLSSVTIDGMLKKFYEDPGFHGYTHGDAGPGNFFVQRSAVPSVEFIDLSSLKESIKADQSPSGFPEYEFHQCLSGMEWANQRWKLNLSELELQQIQASFAKGYRSIYAEMNLHTPAGASKFFEIYWKLKATCNHLNETIATAGNN